MPFKLLMIQLNALFKELYVFVIVLWSRDISYSSTVLVKAFVSCDGLAAIKHAVLRQKTGSY